MRDFKDHEKLLVDKFYGESPDTPDDNTSVSHEYIKFNKKLESFSTKLSILDDDAPDFVIDTLSIIEQAEEIKMKKKSKYEIVLFILISTIILSIYAALGIIIGPKILLASQAALLGVMPWILIPLAIVHRKGSES